MLSLAVATVRLRWASFVGSFVALACGVALIATSILVIAATAGVPEQARQRFAGAPVLVTAAQSVDFTSVHGDTQPTPVPLQPGLPAAVIAAVAATGRTVEDHTCYAQLADGPRDQVGRAWSSAALGGYRLSAGTAPTADDQVVIGGGRPEQIGQRVRFATADGPHAATVSGVTEAEPFEHAVFFTDARAARSCPAVGVLAAFGDADAVRAAVAATGGADVATVLTGADRRQADPHYAEVSSRLDDVQTPLGLSAAVSGGTAVFVVGATFALSIAQRRRELALLRLIGATRKQLRRLVHREALVVGVLASAAGCALGAAGAPPAGHWLIGHGMVPGDFTVPITWWALLVAGLIGLLTAMSGVLFSSLKAGLVSPGEALAQADVERHSRGARAFRWAGGLLVLGGAVAALVITARQWPDAAANAADSLSLLLAVVAGCVLLAGVLAGPVLRLLTALPGVASRLRGRPAGDGGGIVWATARQGALTAFRRTAATTTPVVLIVAFAGCLLGSLDTIDRAQATEVRNQLAATDLVVTPAGAPGLNRAVVDRVRAVPGVQALVITPTSVMAEQDGESLAPFRAAAADPAALAAVDRLPVTAGSVADLGPETIVLCRTWPGSPAVGQRVAVRLADGTPRTLRVAAVLGTGAETVQAWVTGPNAVTDGVGGPALASRIDLRLPSGTDRQRAQAALAEAVHGLGARLATPQDVWTSATNADADAAWNALLMILGLAIAYAAIALANSLVMTVTDRRRELALLRLAGATKAQVLRTVAVETLMCVAAGTVMGLLGTAISVGGSWSALTHLLGPTPAVVPWATLGALAAACAAVALTAAVVPAALALRGREGEDILRGAA
ncbi:FtsX-like permease family protein [Streptomyces sp. SP17BM10]|uniref:FtsX-like permease family protein n=1 Tax=Streptomyces sp. SP17BM10 TaxID=3002530 RepID=UPI002E76B5A2|nr:FtsX-like permease family protein [Streptomyces sp. SP17BM10]MEE1786170.1 FtsX-like permease family protein [Streptomyces sp. SP17BM10]